MRDIIVRDLRGRVAIGTPEFLRARNAREFRTLGGDPRSRAGVLARVQPDGAAARPVSRVCARRSTAVRLGAAAEPHGTADADARTSSAGGDGEHEVDLMLAGLASGEYQLELAATSPAGRRHGAARLSRDELDRLRLKAQAQAGLSQSLSHEPVTRTSPVSA